MCFHDSIYYRYNEIGESGKMSEKKWLKLVVTGSPQLVDPLSDFLVGLFGAGVEAAAIDEPGYGTVNCYIEIDDLSNREIEQLVAKVVKYTEELASIFNVAVPSLSKELLGEEDWGANWKKFFKPFAIVDGLIISPSWENYLPKPGEKIITLDPGMAFGTGHHSTTSLCLELVRRSFSDGDSKTILDVGTGTGILAMAAILFGASRARGLDNDIEAVSSAQENVKRNAMDEKIIISQTPVSELQEQYDVVVANIVHDVLIELSSELARTTVEGGTLILSGILDGEQLASIRSTFLNKGFEEVALLQEKEWVAVQFCKNVEK